MQFTCLLRLTVQEINWWIEVKKGNIIYIFILFISWLICYKWIRLQCVQVLLYLRPCKCKFLLSYFYRTTFCTFNNEVPSIFSSCSVCAWTLIFLLIIIYYLLQLIISFLLILLKNFQFNNRSLITFRILFDRSSFPSI